MTRPMPDHLYEVLLSYLDPDVDSDVQDLAADVADARGGEWVQRFREQLRDVLANRDLDIADWGAIVGEDLSDEQLDGAYRELQEIWDACFGDEVAPGSTR